MMTYIAPVALTSEERNSLHVVIAARPAQPPLHHALDKAHAILDQLQRRLGIRTRKALITRAIVQRWI